MNVLVIGGGGREHAICHALRKSPRIDKLYCAPGNAGIAEIAECVNLMETDIEFMVRFAKEKSDFVIVAPDDPLAIGMVDALEDAGIRTFGPRKNAAMLESSKVFAKTMMEKYGIPTARFAVFSDKFAAKAHIREMGAPIVVKADGLTRGKGVIVSMSIESAEMAVDSMMQDMRFGESGSRVVIEEFMTGTEVTVLAFTDGKTILPMISSQDHKRAYTGNQGPNTGGMGAFCPNPNYTPEIADICMETIFRPTVDAMNAEGRLFKGIIYFGLMLTPKGPKVVEYNARFGDPETQPILMLLKTDLLDILEAVVDERLHEVSLEWEDEYACCVVIASGGYPGNYRTGYKITGFENVPDGVTIFHAGTKRSGSGFVTNGGRVLGITAVGKTLLKASDLAYKGVRCIDFTAAHYRSDIGRIGYTMNWKDDTGF